VFANLTGSGFKGALHAVNPKYEQVHGQRCYASLREIKEPVELAVIASPARTVAGIFKDCGAKDVHNAIVL